MNIALATRAILPRLVAACTRHRLMVLLIAAFLAGFSLWATRSYLGVTTDTGGMFSAELDWKQRTDALAHLFPQNDDLIVAVISARIPEEAEATAAALAARLAADHTHFAQVRQPDTLPYLQKNAFLLIGTPDLQEILNRTIDAQPFLGQLNADPSLRGLFAALGLVVQGVAHGQSIAGVAPALGAFHAALRSAALGQPKALSWEELLAGKLADQAGRFRFVLCKPVLDYAALEPGGAATAVVRAAASSIPWVQSHDAQVRLTGSVVMDDQEFATVAKGAVAGLVGSLVLVLVWLYLAVRSWRLMLPIMATLMLGLLLTTGFAALAIGTLNLISVAFAVLFTGIAVDFAIQFTVRLREWRFTHADMVEAMRETGGRAGAQILVAALATAAGFLAFTPTQFVGVAQLGIIAGVGMMIAFACTLTFLPAMLCLCQPRRENREVSFAFARALDPVLHRHRRWIVGLFGAAALLGGVLAPGIGFDGDPLHTKDPHSEALRVLHDLMADPITNPYTIEAVMPSEQAAQAAAGRLAKLPLSESVLTLDSFLPDDQAQKLALIGDARSILEPTLNPPDHPPAQNAEAFRQAAVGLASALDRIAPRLGPADPLRAIGEDAYALARAPDARLLAANVALTAFLPQQLARLRLALAAGPVSAADIPAELRRDWVLQDGRARLQVLPRAAVNNAHQLRSWVKAALKAVPQVSGSAVWILKSADTITGAFRVAAYSALAAITLILAVALRRALDVALVLVPLMISALLTTLLFRLLGMNLNFANIIALPLLVGVGVSFNIYFVMNWRSGVHRFIGSATARAVMFSALTTSTAFGSLALSAHPGTASMGVLLLMSLGCTVVTSLIFTPALLGMVPAPHVLLGGSRDLDAPKKMAAADMSPVGAARSGMTAPRQSPGLQ